MSRALRGLAATAALLACGPALAGGYVAGSVGQRALDEEFWGEVDRQGLIGVLAAFDVAAGVPLQIAIGLQASAREDDAEDGSGNDITGAVADLTAGLQFMPLRDAPFRPYFGAGLASVSASGEVDGPGVHNEYDDQSLGWYASGGGLFRLGPRFNLGVDVRWIGGTDIEFAGSEGDADSLAISGLFAWSWD